MNFDALTVLLRNFPSFLPRLAFFNPPQTIIHSFMSFINIQTSPQKTVAAKSVALKLVLLTNK